MQKFDLIIIGSGPGGYVAAIRGAQLGLKTAIIERAELGGVCLNWGCIPTKAMLKSAQVFNYSKTLSHYGIELDKEPVASLAKIVERSRGVADQMSKGVAFLLKKNGVEVITGHGRLVKFPSCGEAAPSGDKVDFAVDVDGVIYEATDIILATGSRPRELPSLPIDGKHIISSREALTLNELPASMLIVGSGAIGCEFAYLYATLGVQVTIVEYLPTLLPIADEEVSKALERAFRKAKITVLTGASVKSVNGNEVLVEDKKGERIINADIVLSAVGIKSNLENLGLEGLGVEVVRDKITVDGHYQTAVPHIFAIGDIIATPALAHVASAEAIACVDGIAAAKCHCGLDPQSTPHAVDYSTIPSCVYTAPEIAWVGMTEQQAREAGYELKIGAFPYTASGKATAAGDRDGFVKLIFNAADDTLLGAHLVGANVTEVLGEVTLAKHLNISAETIASTIHAHPTMHEAIMEAAEAALGKAIHL